MVEQNLAQLTDQINQNVNNSNSCTQKSVYKSETLCPRGSCILLHHNQSLLQQSHLATRPAQLLGWALSQINFIPTCPTPNQDPIKKLVDIDPDNEDPPCEDIQLETSQQTCSVFLWCRVTEFSQQPVEIGTQLTVLILHLLLLLLFAFRMGHKKLPDEIIEDQLGKCGQLCGDDKLVWTSTSQDFGWLRIYSTGLKLLPGKVLWELREWCRLGELFYDFWIGWLVVEWAWWFLWSWKCIGYST